MDTQSIIQRTVAEARAGDAGRGIVRLDPGDLSALGLCIGDVVEIRGRHSAYARALPTHPDQRGPTAWLSSRQTCVHVTFCV